MLNHPKYRQLELSTQILIREAIDHGILVEVLDWADNFIRLSKDGKKEYIKQATKTSRDTYISALIMENKIVSKQILSESGIQVPAGIVCESQEDAYLQYEKFAGRDTVVKPNSTNFGKGVVILRTPYRFNEYEFAVKQAFHYDSTVIVEEFVQGKEYRFLIIDDEVVGILHRVPANVTGDGMHSIRELVDIKNEDPLRGEGYVLPLEKIRLGEVEREYLRLQGLQTETILPENKTVYLRENSNISTGGDSVDYTDDIIEEYKEIAINAAKAVGAKICGADIIIEDIKALPNNSNHSVIELNFNPALHIHEFPAVGTGRRAAKKVLALLQLI